MKKDNDIVFTVTAVLVGLMALGTSFGAGYFVGQSNLPDVEVPLSNGQVTEIQIDENDPVLGDEDAPVTIVEFSDYECPYCARHYSQSYDNIKNEYVDQGLVKVVFKDLPLEAIHPNAVGAAVIAECAYDQGGDEAYFEVHNRIFDNMVAKTGPLSKTNIFDWIADVESLDMEELRSCSDNNDTIARVEKDLMQATELGINGTPAIFVNGVFFNGAYPYSEIKAAIDAELAK